MSNWIAVLKTIAPTVAAALGGPLAGAAVAAVGAAIGLDSPTKDAIEKALQRGQMPPDALAKLQELELEYQNQERERGFKFAELEFKDRADARAMQSATKSLMPAVLTLLITFGFFGVLGWMLYDSRVVDSPPLLIMLGSLGTAWTGACAFWFGTTSGSKQKTELLAASTPAK